MGMNRVEGSTADTFREWVRTFAMLQNMFRRAEWYRVQDREVGAWSKTMQLDAPLGSRN